MSFLSVLKSIGHAIGVVAHDASPFAGIIAAIPVIGPVANTVLSTIISVEQLVTAPGTGTAKKQIATQIINTVAPGIDQTTLSTVIDEIVTALNALGTATGKLPAAAALPTSPTGP